MTGQYDRKAQGEALTAANTARRAADPFAGIPATDDNQAPDEGAPAPAAEADCPACDRDPAEAPVTLFAAEWPYPELPAADFSALYAAAAEQIKTCGYYAYDVQGYHDEPGIGITAALKMAARDYAAAADPDDTPEHRETRARDITEELETRLSAVLYLFGQAHYRTGISDFSDVHVSWSLGHFSSPASGPHTSYRVPSAAYALALLDNAARVFRHIADDTAPVTEAPAPTRM